MAPFAALITVTTTMAAQGPPLDLSDEEMDRPPPRARQKADAANTEDPEPKVLRLPTAAELDEGYVFDRDHRAKVSISTIQPPEDPLTNQPLLNIIHAREVYELLKSDVHHDVSHMTLRPISYIDRTDGEPREEAVRFDEEGGRTKFLDELERWKVRAAFNNDNW